MCVESIELLERFGKEDGRTHLDMVVRKHPNSRTAEIAGLTSMGKRLKRVIWLSCALTLTVLGPGWAGPTDPTLVLSNGLAVSGSSRLVRLHGVFPGDDLVQVAYPLQLLVRSLVDGTSYVRYELATEVLVGTDPALADGLDPADVPGLLAAGVPSPDGAVVFLSSDQIDVLLPASFPVGGAEAQLFVLEPGETVAILSNALQLQVPAP
ncbi:MAG: hypothetical protein JRG94_00335 [Deltaproteobacteria bacterium]|nr:hypothetical protein [Deltaproteobacteria bacterium]MBW2722939.1 hypothetical protein [Deltaproteobacteria bacterium]